MSEERETRNSVFTGDQVDPAKPVAPHPDALPAPAGVRSVSAVDVVKSEFGVDIPIETVPLPSSGKVYPPDHPLHMCETVEIRSMTTREEDILTSQALLKKGTVISELIKSCLVNNQIDPSALLTGDRNALMVAIRTTGYGPEYDAEVTCSACDEKSNRTFMLTSLPIKRLAIEPVSPGVNAFEFLLPKTGVVARFKFLTGGDEEEIITTQDRQKKLGLGSSSTVTTNLLHTIVSLNGKTDRQKIATFVRNMPAMDSRALREHIRKNEPGITMRQEVTCPRCGESEEVGMPLGVNFLWPTSS